MSYPVARAQQPHPPVLAQLQAPGVAYLPDGTRIALPAGAELDNCAVDGAVDVYDPFARVQPILPCAERPIFRDGFE